MHAITTGTWNLDAAHSDVDFVVRHAGISKVRGTFHAVEGQLVIAEEFTQSSVEVTVDVRPGGGVGPGAIGPVDDARFRHISHL